MRTEGKGKAKPTKEERSGRKTRIAADQARVKEWAEQQRIRRLPIAVAEEIRISSRVVLYKNRVQSDSRSVILHLQRRKLEILKELSDIDTAIIVIKNTYRRS